MAPTVDPDNKKLFIVLIFAGILMIGLIVYVVVTYSSNPRTRWIQRSCDRDTGKSWTHTTTGLYYDPKHKYMPFRHRIPHRSLFPPRPDDGSSAKSHFVPTTISVQTTATGLPVTAAQVDSSGDVNPQPFTLTVSPASTSGKPGETIILYTSV